MCENCGHSFALKCNVSIDTARKSARVAMRCKRALEIIHQTMSRQEQFRAYITRKRSLESPIETMCRQEQNRANMAKKRRMNVSVHKAITSFF